MCLKQQLPQRRMTQSEGSTLVLALFIILLMSTLVLALLSQQLSSSNAVSYEVQGQRAFNAAQSGLQRALVQLYPLNGSGNCAAVTPNLSFNGTGLVGCSVVISCLEVSNPQEASRPLFRLQSQGICLANEVTTSRVVTMDAY